MLIKKSITIKKHRTSLSLEKTMNALDKNLDQAVKFGKYFN